MASNLENDEGHDQENEQGEARPNLSAPRLVEGVRDLLLLWFKQAHMQKPWPQMSEADQRVWLNRIEERAHQLVEEVVEHVSHGDFPVINAMIESFTVKKGEVKVVTKGFADNEMLSVLNDAGEKRVQITVMRSDQFNQHIDPLHPDPDQPGLPGVKMGDAPGFEDDCDDRPAVDEPPVDNPAGEQEEGAAILTPKSEFWRSGFNSRMGGHDRPGCPFAAGTQECIDWLAGWDVAAFDAKAPEIQSKGSTAAEIPPPKKAPRKPKAGPVVQPDIEPEGDRPADEPPVEEPGNGGMANDITDQDDVVIESDAQAYAYGKRCRADGRGTGANPFPVASDYGKQWLRGYSDERRDEKTRPEKDEF